MTSLHQLVQERKVLYLGISDTPAWVVAAANAFAQYVHWARSIWTATDTDCCFLLQRARIDPLRHLPRSMERHDVSLNTKVKAYRENNRIFDILQSRLRTRDPPYGSTLRHGTSSLGRSRRRTFAIKETGAYYHISSEFGLFARVRLT